MENCIPLREDESVRVTPYTRRDGRWRKRPNHELEYLRQQVIDLEEELAVLRQPDIEVADALESSERETWECIAARQSTQANAALKENLKLSAMLEGQLRVARTLENVVDQHWKKSSRATRWFSGEAGRPCAASLSDELIYALLEEDMADQYACVDKVLETSIVAFEDWNSVPKLRVEQDADGVSFHHCETRLLPFPVSSVVHALQNLLNHGDAGRPMKRCRKLVKSDDHLQGTTVDRLHLPNARQVEVKARLVQRAYPEATRTVFLWAAYVEVQGSMFVRLEEKGWIVLEHYHFKKNDCIVNTPGSKLRSVVRVTPNLQFSSEAEEKEHIGELTDLVIGIYNRNFGLLYQVLENLMVDNSINEANATKN